MTNSSVYKIFIIVGMLVLFAWLPVSAQDNLLVNPGFEAPYQTIPGDPNMQVADGWSQWHIPAVAGAPSFSNRQPEYAPTAPDTSRILAGENAQYITSFFATHDGGVYQRVEGISQGATLTFSVQAYVWSTTFDDVDLSEDDGDVFVQVGIDPTGGTDATSDAIVWSPAGVEQYDSYNEYSIQATAEADAVTVFVRTTVGLPIKNNYIYLDEASLTATGGSAPVQPTAIPTDEPVQPTDIPPTDVPVVPTAVPVQPTDVPVQPTDVPTEEPTQVEATEQPTEVVPTATSEGEDIFALTATSIVAQATQTALVPSPTADQVQPTTGPNTQSMTATAIIAGATATSGARQTAVAMTPSPVPTMTATRPPLTDTFPGTITHQVRRGESVYIIANLYGSTIEAIAEANGLDANYLIHVNQNLVVPVRIPNPATSTPTPAPVVVVTATQSGVGGQSPVASGTEYIVLPGDTLLRIAQLHNTTVATLAQLNGIVNIDRIQAGQRLRLPAAPATPVPPSQPQTYQILPGDTLFRLSLRFGVSMADLAAANNIVNPNLIYAGQVITIP